MPGGRSCRASVFHWIVVRLGVDAAVSQRQYVQQLIDPGSAPRRFQTPETARARGKLARAHDLGRGAAVRIARRRGGTDERERAAGLGGGAALGAGGRGRPGGGGLSLPLGGAPGGGGAAGGGEGVALSPGGQAQAPGPRAPRASSPRWARRVPGRRAGGCRAAGRPHLAPPPRSSPGGKPGGAGAAPRGRRAARLGVRFGVRSLPEGLAGRGRARPLHSGWPLSGGPACVSSSPDSWPVLPWEREIATPDRVLEKWGPGPAGACFGKDPFQEVW